jgi:hypothetical protein
MKTAARETSGAGACVAIAHHLRTLGWPGDASGAPPGTMLVFDPPAAEAPRIRAAAQSGTAALVLAPGDAFCAALGVQSSVQHVEGALLLDAHGLPATCRAEGDAAPSDRAGFRLRTLHPVRTFRSTSAQTLVGSPEGEAVWSWLPTGAGGVLLIGTDLHGDILRYRQGDPRMVETGQVGDLWGYPGERPNFLFENQRSGESRHARHADEWMCFLSRSIARATAQPEPAMLPDGAPGAVVLTGDDDGASPQDYAEQLRTIGDLPISYYIHKDTRLDAATLSAMLARTGTEIGLHPDALDCPDRYPAAFREQADWLHALCGVRARSVRNHGFLNDGYWGHLPTWLEHGIEVSSNLPGFDGNVLNGSLLPARLEWNGELTPHWSVLTSIGDGVVFVNKWSEQEVARCVYDAADAVRHRGLPGVLVFNLHPANIAKTGAMHAAVMDVIRDGFVPWNLSQCHRWFARLESGAPAGT